MSLSPALRRTAYALPLVFALAANVASAGGLASGACYTDVDAAKATLKQEGQDALILGNRLTLGSERPANVFYVNSQGYGYNIEGDASLGGKSTKLCVGATFKDVHLNNPNNPEPPAWAKDIKVTGNGIDVKKAYQNGARIIFGARTYTVDASGKEIPGKYIVVSRVGNEAAVWSIDSLGRADTSFLMEKTGITPKMADIVNGAQASSGSMTLAAK